MPSARRLPARIWLITALRFWNETSTWPATRSPIAQRAAAIGHMHAAGAGHLPEHHRRQVVGRPGAGRGEAELAGGSSCTTRSGRRPTSPGDLGLTTSTFGELTSTDKRSKSFSGSYGSLGLQIGVWWRKCRSRRRAASSRRARRARTAEAPMAPVRAPGGFSTMNGTPKFLVQLLRNHAPPRCPVEPPGGEGHGDRGRRVPARLRWPGCTVPQPGWRRPKALAAIQLDCSFMDISSTSHLMIALPVQPATTGADASTGQNPRPLDCGGGSVRMAPAAQPAGGGEAGPGGERGSSFF